MDTSPIGWTATIVSIVAAVLAVLVAFGVPLTEDMKISLLGLFSVVAPVVVWWQTRNKTTPMVAPKDEQGVPLVRETDHQPPLQAQKYEAKKRAA